MKKIVNCILHWHHMFRSGGGRSSQLHRDGGEVAPPVIASSIKYLSTFFISHNSLKKWMPNLKFKPRNLHKSVFYLKIINAMLCHYQWHSTDNGELIFIRLNLKGNEH